MTKRVLLVEDDESNRIAMGIMLRLHGWLVLAAANGEEAIDFIDAGMPFDLALVDLMMPGADGWTVAQRVSQASRPVILLTGCDVHVDDKRLHTVDRYYRKPIQSGDLLSAMERLVLR